MEVISSLWDSGFLGAIFTAIVTMFGQLSALNTQKFTAVLETLQKQQSADVSAHDAAFARTKDDGGTWVRRVMLFMAFLSWQFARLYLRFCRHSRGGRDGRTIGRLALGANS